MTNNIPTPVGEPEIAFQGKIIELIHQKMQIGDKEMTYEIARRAPGVRLVVVDKEANKILLTKEYRRESDSWDYRLPGGKVFNKLSDYNAFLEKGGDIMNPVLEAVTREASEEINLEVRNPKLLHTSYCGATVDWTLYYFEITDFEEEESGQELELGEDITINWFTFEEAQQHILDGNMHEDRSVGVLLKYLEKKLM